MPRGYANNMSYLEWKYYGPGAYTLSGDDAAYTRKATDFYVRKADDDLVTTTTGVYNAVYGAQTWAQFNQEANAFGVLPKYPWDKDGWRVISGAAGSAADGAVAENGAVPDTIKPVWEEVSVKAKTIAHAFSVSELQHYTALNDNDAVGSMEYLRSYFSNKHRKSINEQLLRDVDSTANSRIDSIDRVVSNSTEELLINAADSDIYGLDRSVTTGWWHAYVDAGASGTDRDLTDVIIRGLLDNVRENGGNTSLWLTGHDTYATIQGLYEAQVRYQIMEQKNVKIGVNGIDTPSGIGVGLNVSSLYGIPVIISADVTKDTISRLYGLDTTDPEGFGKPRLGIKVMKPTQYFETGVSVGDPFAINSFADEGVYRTMGELICYNFHAQGKSRDNR